MKSFGLSKLKKLSLPVLAAGAFFFAAPMVSEASDNVSLGDRLLLEGKENAQVEELQELLSERGYLEEDAVDGFFDRDTRDAVTAFQKDSNILVDGLAGVQTIGALAILREGDEGPAVAALQEDLKELGYFDNNADGEFDRSTHDAVVDFQSAEDILVDGLAGPQTYGTLHAALTGSGEAREESASDSSSESGSESSSDEGSTSEESTSSEDSSSSESSSSEESTSTDDSSSSESSSSEESTSSDDSSSSESSSSEESTSSEESSSGDSSEVGAVYEMEATAYTAYCDGCTGITYTGQDLRANPDKKVVAVDPDVIPLGSTVYVEGYGEAIAGDIGGAIQGNRIDLHMATKEEALEFGRRTVTVEVLD
ncbi:peptidoglycan-binding protein [Alteribacter natronophilus]|uniref:peptidoglycan-binding protein n=1 Tax=Alteribacter natronophilus TaxID=2583810 RepID=UPI00110D580D|nr:peptidoglycan-binding protein [Alteribacter natronophilus]TMW70307.1 peptidoglycan-binding protein [Alteribacter natronophilus]